MDIQYKGIQSLLQEAQKTYPTLSIFNERATAIKVLCWQPKGNISFSEGDGFKCCSVEHLEKSKSFLSLAKSKNADIALTPEYAMSWDVLYNLFEDRNSWPSHGKLWAFGMEGISFRALKNFIKFSHEKINIFCEDLEDLNENYFCSCLVYLFLTGGELICIVQLKTTAASDAWVGLESKGLTVGNTIYYFEDSRKRCLLSYICADVLNQNILLSLKNNLLYSSCIILHPQLNPKPLHDAFSLMRGNFLHYSPAGDMRFISLNWSANTELQLGEDNNYTFPSSFSVCFYNQKVIDDRLLVKNAPNGLNANQDRDQRLLMWVLPSLEHCMLFTIDCFNTYTLNATISKHNEPIADIYFEYVHGQKFWNPQDGCRSCIVDWDWLQREFGFVKCSDKSCIIAKLHNFFSILNNREVYSDIILEPDGTSHIPFSLAGSETDSIIMLRERIGYINYELAQENIPTKFSELKDKQYKWILHKNGNLIADPNPEEKPPVYVVYIDSENERLIQKGIEQFARLRGEAAKDRLLLYHNTNHGIVYYNNLYNIDINNPALTHTYSSVV